MTLYIENPTDTFTAWNGEKIDGVSHPKTIGTLWDAADLEGIGLHHPAPADAVPANKISISLAVARISGVVKYVHVTEPMPAPSTDPNDYPLNKQQWDWLLAVSGLDDVLDGVLAAEKASDRVAYANLKRLLGGFEFHFAAVFALISQYSANIPAEIDASEPVISAVWMQAKDV